MSARRHRMSASEGASGGGRAALLGTEQRPVFRLPKMFEEYEAITKDEVRDFSPNQLRIWRNGRKRAVEHFVSVVGDKPVNEATEDDGIAYTEWWRDRVLKENVAVKIANRQQPALRRGAGAPSFRPVGGRPAVPKRATADSRALLQPME